MIAAVTAVCLMVLVSMGVLPASAGSGNGTIKIDNTDLGAAGNDNNPHRACGLSVQFFGFDPVAQHAQVDFTEVGSGLPITTTPTNVGGYNFTGPNDTNLIYALNTAGLTLKAQGYHVRVDATVTDATGVNPVSKSKVIWVQACATLIGVDKLNDANGNAAYTDSEVATSFGQDVDFQVTISNPGQETMVIDSVTDEYGAVAAFAVCGVKVGSALAPGDSTTCTFTVNNYAPVVANGSLTDTVRVTAHKQGDVNATATDSDTSTVTTGAAPVLSGTVVKTSNADGNATWTSDETTTDPAGTAVTFRAVVTNTSAVTVNVGALSDTYGPGPAGVGTTHTPTCATAPPATLAAGASFTCEFTIAGYSPAAGSTMVDTFSATLSRVGSTSVTPTGSATVRKDAPAAVLSGTVVKTSDADGNGTWTSSEVTTAATGAAVTFRAVVTNTSAVTVDVGALSDVYGPTPNGTGTTHTPTCLVAPPATLAAGASFTCQFTIAGYAPAAGAGMKDTFSAVLSRVGSVSVTPAGSATVTKAAAPIIIPPAPLTSPDLSIVKAGPANAVKPGDNIAYTLTVSNIGTASASNVQVTDTLPAAMTLVSAGGTGWTCTGTTSIGCSLAGSLAAGATSVVNVVATLAADYPATAVANTAVVLPTDANPANNTDTETTAVTLPVAPVDEDLGISKTGLEDSVAPGDVLSWSIKVTNIAGTPAAGFTVTDVVPDGLSLITVGGADWSCSNAAQTVTCTYIGAPLPLGASSSFQLDSLVGNDFAGTSISNTAVVDPGGVNATNDSATAVTPVVFTGGGGGTVTEPSPAAPAPAAEGGGEALPFTGSYTDRMLSGGVVVLLLGLFLALAGRRRRTS